MRHLTHKIKLSSNKGHQTLLIRNLAMSLIIYDKIKTTESRARVIKPFVEHLVNIVKTKEKREAIRLVEKLLQHDNASRKLFEVIAPKYKDVTGGYLRTTRLGYRNGDNASVVQIEFV